MFDLLVVVGEGGQVWIWCDVLGLFFVVLDMEDDVMFIILLIFVLIVLMNIILGLIMLVKNKGCDIGILCIMGLIEGVILWIFFLCGVFIGVLGMIVGVVLGVFLLLNVDYIMLVLNVLIGGNVWQFEVCGIYQLIVDLWVWDIFCVVVLLLVLFFIVMIFFVWCVVCMNFVEVLCYE